MTLPIAFVDCETTHLDAEIGEAWEVAVILREQDGDQTTDTEYVWEFSINPETVDPEALRIGRWHDRHQLPARTTQAAFTGSIPTVFMTRAEAVKAIVNVLSGAVLVGSNPGFDERFLRKLLGPGSAQWHYRPYDVVQLAAAKYGVQAAGPLPWRTHILSRAVGVEPPSEDAAHTALGDARWARDVHDAAMAQEKFPLSWEGRAQHAIGLYTSTAIELEDVRRTNAELAHDAERYKQDYLSACGTIAAMHAAATGQTGLGPIRGVVEDVEDVRERAEKLRRALHIHLHALRARPGREITTDYVRAVLERLIGHPDETCDLADAPVPPLPKGFTAESCVTVKCVVCEYEFDEDDSHTIHFEDIDTAHATLRSYDWIILADGCAICPDDDSEHQELRAHADTPSPPVSPNQTALEALDEDDEEFEEAGDSDADVFELISDIASRLRDATDEGEYHAVGLIYDLANGRKTVAETRTELAEITFRHV